MTQQGAAEAPAPDASDAESPQVLAAIDLGSNSFHMVIASFNNGNMKVIERSRDMVRLAAGLTPKGKISRKVSKRALDCLRQFAEHLDNEHVDKVRAVGTNAFRKAENAADFLEAAIEALGYPIEVVSGVEEARLVYLGAAHSLPDVNGQRLVVDIGGGSTELIVGKNFEPEELDSLWMGCVSMTEEFFPDGKISEKRWKRARRKAREVIAPVSDSLKVKSWDEVIGTSGTIRSVGKVMQRRGWTDGSITAKALKKLSHDMIACRNVSRLDFSGLSSQRAPVFPGGVVILQAVLDVLDIDEMQVSRGALREGLLYDMLES